MAVVTPVPLFLNDCTVKIGADQYEAGVNGVAFTPDVPTAKFAGMTPTASYSATGTPTWQVKIDYVQDWTTSSSLSNYLNANAGKTVAMTFIPKNKTGKQVTANVTIVPGAIGGSGNDYATDSVTLGCDTPVLSAAPTT